MRPRHRNDRVASQIVRDSSGREHMLLNFFVQGQPHNAAAAPAPGDQSAFGAALERAQASAAALADMSPDDVLAAVMACCSLPSLCRLRGTSIAADGAVTGELESRCGTLFSRLSMSDPVAEICG